MADRFFQRLRGLGIVAFTVMVFAADAHGQTLFVRSDSTPNYPSYRHIDECLTAVYRVSSAEWMKGRTAWTDTLLISQWKQLEKEMGVFGWEEAMRPRPDSAIQVGLACLSRFNPDTATFQGVTGALEIVEALLMVRRDQDAKRFTQRFLDSMRLRSSTAYKDAFQKTFELYVKSLPLLYSEVKQLHEQLLAAVKGDSLYRTIDADLTFLKAAQKVEDTVLYKELAWRSIRNNDAMSVGEREQSPRAVFRLNTLEALVGELTQNQGLDSLSKSTLAYNLYRVNTVSRRIRGGVLATPDDEAVKPYKVLDIIGAYWYTATPGTSSGPSNQGLASYIKQGAVPPGTFPVKNRLMLIQWIESSCHPDQGLRPSGRAYGCYSGIRAKRLKEKYPDYETLVLMNTYGAVGQVGPLQPADEADTLAKQFLGHFRWPGHVVVETTEFFRLEAPDGRRVDLPTPMMEEFGDMFGDLVQTGWYTDKEGYLIKPMKAPYTEWFDRAYEILKNRPSK